MSLPVCLVIRLMRFKMDPVTFAPSKNETRIDFEVDDLDLRPFVAQHLQNVPETVYELYAVVMHEGMLHTGHYYTYAKTSHDSKPKVGWRELNDQRVSPFDPKRLKDEDRQTGAYMLFYRRKDVDTLDSIQESLDLLDPNN